MQIVGKLLGPLEKAGNWLKGKIWDRVPEGVRFISITILYFGLSYWGCSFFTERWYPCLMFGCLNVLVALVLYIPIRDWILEGRRQKQKRLAKGAG